MMLYKLKDRCGNHTMDDGTKVKAGEHVRSDTDLTVRFRGKFEKVQTQEDVNALPTEAELLGEDANSISDNSESVDDSKDDSTDSDESISDDDDSVDEVDDEETDDDDEEENDDEEESEEENDDDNKVDPTTLGEDVTDKFPKAKKINAQVFMPSNGWYMAYDPEDQTLLNEDGKKLQKKKMKALLDSFEDEV